MPPVSMLIKPVSGRCNMRCKYCFYNDVAQNRSTRFYSNMTSETLENIVRKALGYADGFVSFAFQGGEPTLAGLDFYRALIRLQKTYNRRGLRIFNSIQTNGLCINDEWARFLSSNGFLTGLSLDGNIQLHDAQRVDADGKGTYERVLRTAGLLKKHGAEFNILCVVTSHVARNAAEVYNSLKKYGFLQFIPCLDGFDNVKNEYSLTAEDYGKFLDETFVLYYRDYMQGRYVSVRSFDNYIQILLGNRPESCSMSGVCNSYFLIEGDGSCFPCDFYVLDEWKTGNINCDSFERILNSVNSKRFIEVSRHISEACRKCKWFALCRGGCRRNREPFENGLPRLNVYCESFKYLFERRYDDIVRIAKRVSERK